MTENQWVHQRWMARLPEGKRLPSGFCQVRTERRSNSEQCDKSRKSRVQRKKPLGSRMESTHIKNLGGNFNEKNLDAYDGCLGHVRRERTGHGFF
jgi:hypothetical protein